MQAWKIGVTTTALNAIGIGDSRAALGVEADIVACDMSAQCMPPQADPAGTVAGDDVAHQHRVAGTAVADDHVFGGGAADYCANMDAADSGQSRIAGHIHADPVA